MAKEGNAAPVAAAPKKSMLMVIVALVVAVAVGVGAAMMMSGGKKKHRKADKDEYDDYEKAPLVVFKDEFIVNLASTDGVTHFLRIPKVELEVANESVAARVEENKSKVGDRISSTLRARTYEEMKEAGGDIKLKEELKKVINESLGYEGEGRGVKEVLFPVSIIAQ